MDQPRSHSKRESGKAMGTTLSVDETRFKAIPKSRRPKLLGFLGRIQDLRKGGKDKRPPKAVDPRGVRGHMLPRKILNFKFAL